MLNEIFDGYQNEHYKRFPKKDIAKYSEALKKH